MLVKTVLSYLWTPAPTFQVDFVGSSKAVSSVEPTPSKPVRRINRWLIPTAAGSVTPVRPTGSFLYASVQPVFIYRAVFRCLVAVLSLIYSRLFLGICFGD